jgi:hypothetical protein
VLILSIQPYLPGATFVDLGPDGGTYDETGHPKGILHTTEGTSLAGAESAFRSYPPHIGYDPNTRVVHQYIRLDRCSYALKGSESDDEFGIQVEIVGFAAQTHTYPEAWYRNIGEDIIRPLRQIVGIPNNYLTFHGDGEGIILASPSSPIRLSDADFRNYSGWVGHQHVPAPDEHWDPGRFNIALALTYSEDDMHDTDPSAVPIPNTNPQAYYTYREIWYWDNYYANWLVGAMGKMNDAMKQLQQQNAANAAAIAALSTAVAQGEANDLTAAQMEALLADAVINVEVKGFPTPPDMHAVLADFRASGQQAAGKN